MGSIEISLFSKISDIIMASGIDFFAWRFFIFGSPDITLKLWDRETGACLKTIPLLWIPLEIKAHPTKPGIFATANANGTVTFFDFREIIS